MQVTFFGFYILINGNKALIVRDKSFFFILQNSILLCKSAQSFVFSFFFYFTINLFRIENKNMILFVLVVDGRYLPGYYSCPGSWTDLSELYKQLKFCTNCKLCTWHSAEKLLWNINVNVNHDLSLVLILPVYHCSRLSKQ